MHSLHGCIHKYFIFSQQFIAIVQRRWDDVTGGVVLYNTDIFVDGLGGYIWLMCFGNWKIYKTGVIKKNMLKEMVKYTATMKWI